MIFRVKCTYLTRSRVRARHRQLMVRRVEPISGNDLPGHAAAYVGEAEVAAAVAIGEVLVV